MTAVHYCSTIEGAITAAAVVVVTVSF